MCPLVHLNQVCQGTGYMGLPFVGTQTLTGVWMLRRGDCFGMLFISPGSHRVWECLWYCTYITELVVVVLFVSPPY